MKDPTLAAVLDKSTLAEEHGEERAIARPSRVLEEFALLMTSCAQVAYAPPPPELAASAPTVDRARAPAEIWRPIDGAVTGTSTEPAAPAPKTQLVTQIVHKELGAMTVTVERDEDAVRVVFEVADAVARVAVETERGALLSSLYAAGVKIASVVVSVRGGGTAFAHRSSVARNKRALGDAAPEPGPAVPSGLDLVG